MAESTSNNDAVLGWLLALAGLAEIALAFHAWRLRETRAVSEPLSWATALTLVSFLLVLLIVASLRRGSSPTLALLRAGVSFILMAVAGFAALFIAPQEMTMGLIQRIFYFHVPSAWTGFVAFFIVFLAGVAYLVRRRPQSDWLGVAAAEVGVAFLTVVLITGPIWAKPVWGIWWTWDARLTSTFVLWVLFISYLLLRTLIADPERRALASAVFGVFSFLDVPLVYMSIRWWRTQHPQPVIAGGSGSGLDPLMWRVLLTCWAALLALLVVLIRQRFRLESLRYEVQEMQMEADARTGETN